MKLAVLLLTAAFMNVQGAGIAQSVSLSGNNIPLKKVFSAIEQQTGYVVFGSADLFRDSKPVSVSVRNMPLPDFLGMVLKEQSLGYYIEANSIILSRKAAVIRESPAASGISAAAQSLQLLTGRIIDSSGSPLAGATVSVRGTRRSAVTNEKGLFSLNAGIGEVLDVSYIGYTSIKITLTSALLQQTGGLVISLKAVVASMGDVTVVSTGYQNIPMDRAAGSYAQPDKEVFKDRSTSMNVVQRLDGLIPGLTINNAPSAQESGKTPAMKSTVLVRGITSINSSRAPLYVVDGLPMDDISSINPNDVENITVLKDATAASIWGSRASNGVIVISTKRGIRSDKVQIAYDGFVNVQNRPNISYFPTLNSAQLIRVAQQIFDPVSEPWGTISNPGSGGLGIPPHELILYNQYRGLISSATANAELDSLSRIDNRQQIKDLFYRKAVLTNHTLSFRAGGNKYGVYGSASYTGAQDNTPGNSNNTYKIDLRQDLTFSKRISAYLITDLTDNRTKTDRPISPDSRFLPYALFRDASGNNIDMPWLYSGDSLRNAYETKSKVSLNYNPLDNEKSGYTHGENVTARVNGGVNVNLVKGLRFQGVYGYLRGINKTTAYDDMSGYLMRSELVSFTVASTTPGGAPTYYLPTSGGKYGVRNINNTSWTVRNQLTYDQNWGGQKHQLTVLAGQEAQQSLTNTMSSTVRGYDPQLLTYAQINYQTLTSTGISGTIMPTGLGKSVLAPDVYGEQEQEVRLTSYYSTAGYTYLNKYTLNVSGRIDKSNLFGKDKSAQNKPVWSTGAKWLMSDESFMHNIRWINSLDLRATYGLTGISPSPGSAASFDILSAGANSQTASGIGYTISTPANNKLTWESTKTYNLGLDFSILHQRLRGSADAYLKKTSNLIAPLPVDNFTGYTTITGNLGDMQNKGIEVQLTSLNITRGNFSWNTLVNFAYNTNKITELKLATPISTGTQLVATGYAQGRPAGSLFAYNFAGLDGVGDPQVKLADKTITKAINATKPGDIVFKGTYVPKLSGGMLNTFGYKGWRLSANIIYNLGAVMRRDVNTFWEGANITPDAGSVNTGNINSDFLKRWQNPGDEKITNIPAFTGDNSARASQRFIDYYTMGTVNVVSSDYVKLRDITLSYNLPDRLLGRFGIHALTLRLQVNNIMLWKANRYGIDPEFQDAFGGSLFSSAFIAGPGTRSLPVNQHSLTFGVNAAF